MSVYSGFATRQQESFYNKLLERMIQLLSLKLLQTMKKIEDLLIVNQELQSSQQKSNNLIFKNGGAKKVGSTPLGDTSMVKIETLVDEKKQLEDPPPTKIGASTATEGEDHQISPESKAEKIAQAQASVQNMMMFNNDLDRKWVQYVHKIFNALSSMDKQKYLEPKFSFSLYPIIKYIQKKKGTGSIATNISKLTFREGSMINGEPALGGNLASMLSGFNESFSGLLNSFNSGATATYNHLDQKYRASNNELSQTAKNETKHNSTLPQSESAAIVIEQTLEEDDDYPMKVENHINRRNSSLQGYPQSNSRNEQLFCVQKIKNLRGSPHILEPVLEGKRSSRTINGINTGLITDMKLDMVLNGGPLMKILNHASNESQLSNQSFTYQESQSIKRNQGKASPKSIVSSNPKKKAPQRNTNVSYYSNQSNTGVQKNQTAGYNPQTLLESAYRTTNSNGFNINHHQALKNFTNQNTLSATNSQASYQAQQKKSQRLIRTLIERKNVNQLNLLQQQQLTVNQNSTLNQDVKHIDESIITQPSPEINNQGSQILELSVEIESPDKAVIQSYFNNNNNLSQISISGDDNSRTTSTFNHQQHSQVNIKNHNTNDYECLRANNAAATMYQSTGFMISRSKKKGPAPPVLLFKQVSEKKKLKSKSTHGVGANAKPSFRNMASIIFDDVYNAGNPDQMLVRLANNNQSLQSRSAQKRSANWEAQSQKQQELLNQNSQRSLHSNYLQNLNELVKIHNEMKNQGQMSKQRLRMGTTTYN